MKKLIFSGSITVALIVNNLMNYNFAKKISVDFIE